MEQVSEILSTQQKYRKFLEKGKALKEWYLNNGYIRTIFGWMHKDWISEAFRQGWISGRDPMTYSLVIPYHKKNITIKVGRANWPTKDKKLSFDETYLVDSKRGEKTLPFFKWLEDKKGVFSEIHN